MSAYSPYDDDGYGSYDDDSYDSYDEAGGHPDWPPNLKLKAIRGLKVKAEEVEADLTTEWRTSGQTIPSTTGSGDVNPTIVVGGGTVESLKTALDDDVWDSPAAEGYRTWITGGIDSVSTVLGYIVDDLTTAQTSQENNPGKRAEPGSPEATWREVD